MTTHPKGLMGRCAFFAFRLLFAFALCGSVFAQAPAPEPVVINEITANTIRLSWNDIYDDEDGFRLERYDLMTGFWTTIAWLGPNAATYLDTGLTAEVWYEYKIVAFNSGGDSYPAYASAQATPVPAPEPVVINEVTANTIRLSWNDIYNDEDGFRLERYDWTTGFWTTIAWLGPNVATYLDTGLTAEVWYEYRIVAFNSGGDSYPAYASAQATPVPAPEPVVINEVTANTIRLSWNDIYNDEDGFRLERYDWTTGFWTTIAWLGPNVSTYLDIGLTAEVWYEYRIVAFNSGGDSYPAYASAQATPVPAPEPVVINEMTANTIRLSWNDIYNNEDGFRLERYDGMTGFWTAIAWLGPNVATHLDTGLTAEVWYEYRIVAFNSGGDSYPAYASAQATPVPAPEPVVINEVTANTIRLSWNDIYNNEDGFRLERYDGITGSWTTIAWLGPDVTTHLDTGLTPFGSYEYRIVAFNSGGDSYPAYAFAQAMPISAPEPLVIEYTTANTIALSWNDIYNNEDGFRVQRYDPASGNYVTIAILAPNVTTFLDTGLTPVNSYEYRVMAFNSSGDSYPAYASAEATPVPSPGPLLITSVTANTISLAWSDIYTDEDGFRIRRYDSVSGVFGEVATVAANVTTFRDTGLTPGVLYYYEVVAFNAGGESYPADAPAQATPVAAPDPLIVTGSTATTISLAWNDIYNDEDGFRLERSEDGATYGVIAQLPANQTNYVDTGLAPEGVHYYRVLAFNSGGDSYYSMTVSAGATPVPAPDPLVVGTVSATQIALSWNDIYSDEDGFRLERSTDSILFTPIASLPANTTNYVDANLLPNTFYAYRVAGFNSGGDSYYSMTVNATTLPLPPFPPSTLSATAVSPSQINLSWRDTSNNETAFEIERSPDGLNFTLIATVPAGTNSYADTGLAEATLYWYRVRARNLGGSSDYSNEAGMTTLASTLPTAPSNLTLQAVSSSQINLSWQDNAGNEFQYFVEIATAGGAFTQIAQLGANAQSYSATSLNSNTRYTFRVRCANNVGSSGYSNTANIKTLK